MMLSLNNSEICVLEKTKCHKVGKVRGITIQAKRTEIQKIVMTVQESESASPVQLTRELIAAAREVSALASQLKEPTAEVFVIINTGVIAAKHFTGCQPSRFAMRYAQSVQ